MMRCSPEWASGGEVPSSGEQVGGGADEGSLVQLFGPERDDMLGEARGCSGWTGGGQKATDDDELLMEEDGARRWRLRGWSVAQQLTDAAEPA
jgi:hypothetical protein